tara:strand:- start:5538 stop:5717 length:180 start_codon:yes stop_codon:yes gene_type:complete
MDWMQVLADMFYTIFYFVDILAMLVFVAKTLKMARLLFLPSLRRFISVFTPGNMKNLSF